MPGSDDDFIRTLGNRIAALLPPGVPEPVLAAIRGLLRSAMGQLDVVSREDFDTQAELLASARQRLDALAERVARLEAEAARH